ncbi:prolyl oligopeptidase family serine peptidase, partial [Arthrospira platensis SPKY1]|nr:prolyl oligopeptidase family serine peptidase [Arthrospira platensis SPKY1]
LKKGLKLDGKRPALLLAEGGFGAVRSPRFDPAMLSLLENEGVLAQAVVRGGREYGREWYESGIRSKKENAINDFQAATGYLISEGYSQREKLAIWGRGAEGGLLVAASITQRPDLFRVAIASSGLYDLVRYQQFTIGSKWAYDLG